MTNELAIRILTGDVLGTTEQTQEAVTMAVKALSRSSAQPERRWNGKWIYVEDGIIHGYCSYCGFQAIYQETDVFGCDFCPNCGARMGGENDE